jgi:transposase
MSNIDYAAIEVSRKTLTVKAKRNGRTLKTREFSNTARGHKAICRHLGREGREMRVVLEATGIYSLDLAIALACHDWIEVMVVNPTVSYNFRNAMFKRSKNDVLDVGVLLEFAERMEFKPFVPPTEAAYTLRSVTREIQAIRKQRTMAKNRLHAAENTRTSSPATIKILKKMIEDFTDAIKELTNEALALIASDPVLKNKSELLRSIPGVGESGSVQLVGELAMIPEFLSPRQLTAIAGLDPVEHQSGTSVYKRKGISKRGNKRLRVILFMAALTSVRVDENIKAFYQKLINRGKKKIQALVAVMRKLLHCICGMIRHNQPFDSSKFYCQAH